MVQILECLARNYTSVDGLLRFAKIVLKPGEYFSASGAGEAKEVWEHKGPLKVLWVTPVFPGT